MRRSRFRKKFLLSWINTRLPLSSTWKRYFSDYYVPKNLNIYYCLGAIALVVLLNQFLSGLWLTMFYTPTITEAFHSVQQIMRDVQYGWLFRYMHSTGASAFFIVLYLHIFRGLLYGSYQKPRELVWIFGVLLFVLILSEAFFGYLLPWGQLSYWSAQVITSLMSTIPYIGDTLVTWIRGDLSVGNPTLQRFFALHVIAVPAAMALLVFLHIVALHQVGSNNPEGIEIYHLRNAAGKPLDGVPFHPYYLFKDLLAVLVFSLIFFTIVFFYPDMGGYFLEKENFIPANPLQTPERVMPSWYMLPFYTMLRATSNKTLGVMLMCSAVLLLFFLPWLDNSPVRSMRYKGNYSKIALCGFILSFLMLGYLGCIEITSVTQHLAQLCMIIYFAYFLLMPIYTRKERCKNVPERIKV